MLSGRLRTSAPLALLLSLLFGGGWALLSAADALVAGAPAAGRPLAYTVRLSTVRSSGDPAGRVTLDLEPQRFPRGQVLSTAQLRQVELHGPAARAGSLLTLGLVFTLVAFLFQSFLRACGGLGQFVRTHLVILASLSALLVLAKLLLMLTAWSALWVPLAALPLLVGQRVGRRAAAGAAVLGALALALLIPFDIPLLLVMLAQGLMATAAIRRGRGLSLHLVLGALLAAAAGAATYLGLELLLFGRDASLAALLPNSLGASALLGSDLCGSAGSAIAAGLLARLALPLFRAALGQISRARLTALAEFGHPLLQQIAREAPGSWAHSTALANLAEMAANRIGADGLLLRVGAYYHDVGKALSGGFFVENQRGENPHDKLEPARSAKVIRDHVTDGVRLAREHDLPRAIVEFIYTHHGVERLEYFWHKARSGDPSQRPDEREFRYRGVAPLTREQAILSVCDAVEAASRTLKDAAGVEPLVRQIVQTKLGSGALDGSGLDVRDLRLLTEACVEYLQSSLHSRVQYPWQEKKGAGDKERREDTGPEQPVPLTRRRR